ncbi:hypothetical protein GCM10022280_16520 [Sphingomonas swuensis]|uniref:histidine kinase n=1 Tax=Sphingomonas swuensis TaxID=977800 RepID=A0ABP7SXC8_9SPHN
MDRPADTSFIEHGPVDWSRLADQLPQLVWIADASGAISWVNRRFEDYSGMPGTELAGRGWRRLVHPDDLEVVLEEYDRAVASSGAFECTMRLRAADGSFRSFLARAEPDRDASGRAVRWFGTSTDISGPIAARVDGAGSLRTGVAQEGEAEEARREAEERFAIIFNSAAVGIGRVSPDGRFLEINDRYCEILGRSRNELLGDAWRNITHPDDLADDQAFVDQIIAGDLDHYSMEKRYLAPDGSDIWVNLSVSAERNPDGSVKYLIPVVEDIGERKQAEQRLRASEERYRTLFTSMEQGFCIIQVSFDDQQQPSDYRFTEINPAFTRQTGLPDTVLHQSVRDVVPDLERSWFTRYGEVARTGNHIRFIDRAEALGRWFEVYAFPIGDLEDRNVALLFSDVTDRIEKEDALRLSEQDTRMRLNAIPQMVWSTLPDGYHDFYNDRWYEFTGTPLGSTDGEGWNGMFHPDDQARAFEHWRQCLESGEPYEIEYRLRHHTGEYRWVLGRALPIRDEGGTIIRWMGTCTDIDDRIAADRALRESEARLRAVIEGMPVGLVFADAAGRLSGSNRMLVDLIAHEVIPSERVENYADDYVAFHEDGRQVESHEYPLARALRGEKRPELECLVNRGDGSQRWLRYVASPIRDADGGIAGAVVASIDIDREKRLTESLEREVEKVVAERELAQEALRQSQKLESMGQLTGGVAHDFNNLLTPIIGSLDLLQRKQVLDARTSRLVEGALASAEKARVLVQRLLAFARRQPLRPQAVDLSRIVAEMSELVDSTSGPRVRVDVDMPGALPPALADGNQLEMALLNLAVNARDAMPEGGTLTIAVRSEQAGAGSRLGLGSDPFLVLGVSDTGVGMDEVTRRRAIEPFFSTKGIGKGTGLGLSMVHGLAAQLGGALDIRSAPNVGTTIELWLPVASSKLVEDVAQRPEASRRGAGLALLVDDEELVRASTASMLVDLGYDVVEASSGEEAVARVQDGAVPDILVTDQLMPGLSGTDLAVRLTSAFPSMHVLVVSGYADLDSLSPSFPHLSKPFRQAELAEALAALRSPAAS